MNIAIITSEIPYPNNSGGRIYTWERIKVLKDKGHNIRLYSFIENDDVVEKEIIAKYCDSIALYSRNKNIIKNIINIFKPYSAYTRYNKELKKDLINDCKNIIDLIIVDSPQLFYNIDCKLKKAIICTQHNIEYKTFINIANNTNKIVKKISYLFEGFKLKLFEKKLYKSKLIDGYTFISEEDKKFFEKEFKYNRNILIPIGYRTKKNNKHNKKNNIMVFTGKMNYYPNVEAVLWFCSNIFPKIKSVIEDAEFYIVGKSPTEEVKDLNKINGVHVTGEVDNIEYYLDMAKLVVIPLLSGGGVKIKLIEALGSGNVVVSTTKGVEGTEFNNNEHLIVADEINDFSNKCIDVLKNREKYLDFINKSNEMINNKYSWHIIGNNYNSFINNIYHDKNNTL